MGSLIGVLLTNTVLWPAMELRNCNFWFYSEKSLLSFSARRSVFLLFGLGNLEDFFSASIQFVNPRAGGKIIEILS